VHAFDHHVVRQHQGFAAEPEYGGVVGQPRAADRTPSRAARRSRFRRGSRFRRERQSPFLGTRGLAGKGLRASRGSRTLRWALDRGSRAV
jgi:hypothetical protein